ncbi:MAG: universal stress protein, partial [Acidimicrobiales bacterium]
MNKKTIVGIDDSPGSAVALHWAGRLVTQSGGDLVAVHAFRPPSTGLPLPAHERLVAERRSEFEKRWTEKVVGAGGQSLIVHDGDPRDVIEASAEAENASLVVVGQAGEAGGPGFLHLGSVAEYLAHNLNRPLAVIPASGTDPIKRIIVGVDGSDSSRAAVEWCASVAKAFDSEVVAVAVEEPFFEWTPASSPKNWRRDVEHRVEALTTALTDAGVPVDVVAQRDLHPANGLLAVASARSGDLLVVGARGAGGFTGLRVGGVAMKVLHRANLPLVLVPT